LVRKNGSNVGKLLLYRAALDMAPGAEQVEVDVIAVISGDATVTCTVCGGTRSWFEAPGAVLAKMKRMEKKGKHGEVAGLGTESTVTK
jgi:hypothetical protein